MGLGELFSGAPCQPEARQEVDTMVNELLAIARVDDFLSERPGGVFNMQCKHVKAREIGKRLGDLGDLALMEWAFGKIKRKLGKQGKTLTEHLGYCWNDLNHWQY